MVFINDRKFACESCVKGHRSSSCKHTDRPLFEIKKKGRPVSQCEKCRELRQSKRVHSKCLCNPMDEDNAGSSSSRKKIGRFIPVTPSLPNGISDAVFISEGNIAPNDSKQRVDSLLNPCNCASALECQCRAQPDRQNTGSLRKRVDPSNQNKLASLARAAAMYCGGPPTLAEQRSIARPVLEAKAPHQNTKRQGSRPSTPPHSLHKRHKRGGSNPHPNTPVPGPSLAPLLYTSSPTHHEMPQFPVIPPISTMTSLAGSGCTCGLYCACPGCVEHRGEEHALKDRPDCASGKCGNCVDRRAGVELPAATGFTAVGGQGTRIMNQFLARAAALPAPPQSRNRFAGLELDPMNVMVYPANIFTSTDVRGASGAASTFDIEGRDAVFGLVKVPKLECCGGRCGCPEDGCSCGTSCEGRCNDGENDKAKTSFSPLRTPVATATSKPVRSCCAQRITT